MKQTQISVGAAVATGQKFKGFSVRNPGADAMVLNFRDGVVGGDILATCSLAASTGTQTVVLEGGIACAGIYTEKVSGTGTPVGAIYHD